MTRKDWHWGLLLAGLLLLPALGPSAEGEEEGKAAPAVERPGKEGPGAPAPKAVGEPAGAQGQAPLPGEGAGEGAGEEEGEGKEGGEGEEKKDPEKEREELLHGAHLETDSELERLLRNAQEFLDEKKYREGVVLLQHLIDTAGSALTTADGRVFRPTRELVESILVKLPAEALEVYRLNANAEAKGLLGDLDQLRDSALLRTVVRRFFASDLGDDAAFLLACLWIDQHDFRQAGSLLRRLLSQHPRSSIPRGEILKRLAVVQARLGERAAARASWEEYQKAAGASGVELFKREWEGPVAGLGTAAEDGTQGRQRGLSEELLRSEERLWDLGWSQQFELKEPPTSTQYRHGVQHLQSLSREMLVASWEDSGLPPVNQIIVAEGRVYYRSHDTLFCCDQRSGKLKWSALDSPPAAKPGSQNPQQVFYSGNQNRPDPKSTGIFRLFFNDRLGKVLSLHRSTLFVIEENYRAGLVQQNNFGVQIVNGKRVEPPPQAAGNALAAYDAVTGKRLWRLGREVDEKKALGKVHFLAAPVPCGDLVLTVVATTSELLLVGLDPRQGTLLWQTFLSSPPLTGQNLPPQQPMGIAVEGGEVFVASGNGVVFAVDGYSGQIRWASRYERTPLPPADAAIGFGFGGWPGRQGRPMEGWGEDFVAVIGERVLVLPSDAKAILAFDRSAGQRLYRQDVESLGFCIGADAQRVYLQVPEGIAAFDIAAHEFRWRFPLPGKSVGRAAWAAGFLYVPLRDSIACLDPQTGKAKEALKVRAPEGDPLGNLWVEGEQILVGGMDRVYALVNAGEQIRKATAAIEANQDPQAYLRRGMLHKGAGRFGQAIEDLRNAHQRLTEKGEKELARSELLTVLLQSSEADLAKAGPFLDQARALMSGPEEEARVVEAQARHLAASGEKEGALDALLRLAGSEARELVASGPEDLELKVLPRVKGQSALRRLLQNDPGSYQPLLEARAQAALQRPELRKDWGRLVRSARVYLATQAGARAYLDAAQLARQEGQLAVAERILRELFESEWRSSAAQGLAALAELHRQAGWPRLARREWQQLDAEFGEVQVGEGPNLAAAAGLAKERLAALPVASGEWPLPDRMPQPPWRLRWASYGAESRPLALPEGTLSEFLESHLLLSVTAKNRVVCRDLASGKATWMLETGKAQQGHSSGVFYSHTFGGMVRQEEVQGLKLDGHLAFFQVNGNLAAHSLLDGREVWRRAPDPAPAAQQPGQPVYINTNRMSPEFLGADLDLERGVVLQRLDDQRVRALDLLNGEVLWERRLRRQFLTAARFSNSCAILSLGNHSKVMACDRRSGALLKEVDLGPGVNPQGLFWTPYGFLTQGYSQAAQETVLELRRFPSAEKVKLGQVKGWLRLMPAIQGRYLPVICANTQARLYDLAECKELAVLEIAAEPQTYLNTVSYDPRQREVLLVKLRQERKENTYSQEYHVEVVPLDQKRDRRRFRLSDGVHHDLIGPSGGWGQTGTDLLPWTRTENPIANRGQNQTQRAKVVFFSKGEGRERPELQLPVPGGGKGFEGLRMPPLVRGNLILLSDSERLLVYEHDGQAKETAQKEAGAAVANPGPNPKAR